MQVPLIGLVVKQSSILSGNEEGTEAEEPKKRIEKLLDLMTLIVAYSFLYIYQNMISVKIELMNFQALTSIAIVPVVILPSIHYLVFSADPLQRSPSSRKPIRFFQNEFPSKYLLERCQRCIENEDSCSNYMKKRSYDHVSYWFNDIFHGAIERENPKNVRDTFEKSYTCKLVYYLEWILWFFLILTTMMSLFFFLYSYTRGTSMFNLTALQILFPLTCFGTILLLRMLHKPDENAPTGCWHAWRQINGMHRSWLKHNEDYLVKLICHAGGETKKFVSEDDIETP